MRYFHFLVLGSVCIIYLYKNNNIYNIPILFYLVASEALVSSRKKGLGSILLKKTTDSQVSVVNHRDRVMAELTQYELRTDTDAAIEPEQDPLEFWKEYRSVYPLLSELARRYLCGCATSCTSERFFSITGHIVSKKRSCYKPQLINMLAFLSFNMKKWKYSTEY